MSIDVRLRHGFGAFSLDCAFSIDKPGITALFGPSGSGKTTIVRAIAGLLRPQSGRIVLSGRVVLDTDVDVCYGPHARRTGYVFQDGRLFPHMNVENNLLFGWRRADLRVSDNEIASVIGMLGLENLLARMPANLSGGEKGRVALGRALLSSPDVLLLDEPLAALDRPRKQEIFPYFERLRDEARLPIVYVSHSLDEVTRLADNVVVLDSGRVKAQGSVFDLASSLGANAGSSAEGLSGYGAVIETRVAKSDDRGVTRLSFPGGSIAVAPLKTAEGTRVRVRIRAEDVMIACEEPKAISANNVLPATIAGIAREASHADIQLACGEARLVARITLASLSRLSLREGMAVFAVVKSVIVAPGISTHSSSRIA